MTEIKLWNNPDKTILWMQTTIDGKVYLKCKVVKGYAEQLVEGL